MCVRLLAPRVTSCTSLKASSWQSYLQNFEESFASLTLWRHVRQACYAFVNIFCTVAIVVLLTVSDRHCELCIMGYVCVCCRLRTCVLWTTSLCLVVFIMYLCSCVSVVSCNVSHKCRWLVGYIEKIKSKLTEIYQQLLLFFSLEIFFKPACCNLTRSYCPDLHLKPVWP